MRWVERYKKCGNVYNKYREPVAYKVHKKHVSFLLDEIKNNKTITLQELTHKLKNKYKDVDLSTTQIFRVINDNNVTLKLTRFRHEPNKRFGKDININEKLEHFYNEVKNYKIEVFKKYTGVFAISTNGVIGWDLYEKGGINGDRLIEFLEENIINTFKNKLIILDNASCHRNIRIQNLINKHNNILYAVPYQHFTNSIENYFSMLKSRLQKLDGLKYNELKANITKVINEIPEEKYENIFKGAYERPEKYVAKNKTRKIKKNYK